MDFLYILLAVFIFGALVFVHELGHFLVARLCGVRILEFAIGMGPKLFSWKSKKSGTAYSLRALPLGGYVMMFDGDRLDDGNQQELSDASALQEEKPDPSEGLRNQSLWKRVLISLAGPFMNLLLGFIMMLVVVIASGKWNVGTTTVGNFHITYTAEESFGGLTKGDYVVGLNGASLDSFAQLKETVAQKENEAFELIVQRLNEDGSDVVHVKLENVILNSNMLDAYFDGSLSEGAGLQIEDEIIKVNGTRVHTAHELSYEIMHQGYAPMKLTVLRNGEKLVLENVIVPSFADSGATFGSMDFRVYAEESFGMGTVLKHTWYRSLSSVKMIYDSLSGLFSGRYGMQTVSGPVGITKTISDAAKTDWLNVFYLVTLISMNLGVMNLLPIPGLDGGHLFLYFVEGVRRKPLKREIEGMINFAGLAIMLALAILIAIKDIISL